MEYLVRFAQVHESFRLAELEALALLEGIDLKIIKYDQESPFSIVRLPSEDAARQLVRRAVLVQTIFEFWGQGSTLEELHNSVRSTSSHLWPKYTSSSFKFWIDSFQCTRANSQRLALIQSFSYLPFKGEIKMVGAEQEFTIFEDWIYHSIELGIIDPKHYYVGRRVAIGGRELPQRFDLKKRRYISTTSMDSELALVTANICMAGPGRLMYDPFAGTASFPIACAEFGAIVWGSDIDGRSIRGDEKEKTIRANFDQYGLLSGIGGFFTADLTNSPIRRTRLGTDPSTATGGRMFDGILCDPPYGVREGLVVLGVRDPTKTPWTVETGIKMYKNPEFIPPKKPYGFIAMLHDILQFAAETLVDNGRLSFWMPTSNDEDQEIAIPTHPYLELVVVCVQNFNKWSRKLITYRRRSDAEVAPNALETWPTHTKVAGVTADELNPFRKGYFNKFVT